MSTIYRWPLCLHQRWPKSLFPTPLLFQNFWIRLRLFLKFENPTPVQTPATIIHPTVIYPCFYLRNYRTDSCYCRNGKVTPGPVFHKFLTPSPDPGPKEKRRILPESTPVIRIRYHLWFEHQWFTDMEILQSWSNPKLFHRLHTQSISEKIKLWTLISNPKPLNQLHISQYNWYCLFCLMRQKLWLFCLLSDKSCWSGHMTSRLRYTKDKS